MKIGLSIAAVLALAGSAVASPILEVEQNNTVGTAQFIAAANYPTGAVAIDGSLGPGTDATAQGVDYFSFQLTAGDFVAVSVFDLTPGISGDFDALLGVFNPGGILVDGDDDDGPELLPSFAFIVPSSGVWTFAVSGAGDADFDGVGHQVAGDYKFVFAINPIPTPGSVALIGLGAIALVARRHRSA